MRILWKPLRMLADALVADSSPRQLAWGTALGLSAGLVPKDNLTAATLMVVICALRVNMAAVAMAMMASSWIGTLADPLTHRLGEWLLRHDRLHEFWTTLANLPVVPWTAFNNTVVLGSFLAGLVLLYPLYRLAEWPARRYLPSLQRRLAQYRIVKWLWGAEWTHRILGTSATVN